MQQEWRKWTFPGALWTDNLLLSNVKYSAGKSNPKERDNRMKLLNKMSLEAEGMMGYSHLSAI